MKKTTNVIFKISEREKELLKKRAEELEMTMSEYIISLIRADLAKKELRG